MRRIAILSLISTLLPVMAVAQTSGFVYALVNNNAAPNMIYGFSLNPNTGALTPLPGFPVASGGTGTSGLTTSEALVYDPAQSRLYAANVNNRVSMFDVDRATGAITALPFSPFFIQGALHGCMAVSPDGGILVAADLLSPFVDSLRIGTSSVTPAPGSPYNAGSPSFSCAFRRDGGAVYTGGNTLFISGWTVSPSTGELTPMPGSPFATPVTATGYATDTLNRLFAVSFTDGAVRAFSIENGAPALLGSPTPSSQTGQIHGVLHPSGYYVATARNSNNVAVFRISGVGTGTTLTQAPGSPFATGGEFSNASVVDASGRIVVTSNGSSRNLTSFLFDSTTGTMTQAAVQQANTLGATGGIVGLAYARFAGTTPTPPTAFPPTITPIPDQTVPQNGSITVPFTIAGAVLPVALRVSVASSNTTLLPVHPSTMQTSCSAAGACALRLAPADGRFGTATVTVTVSDGFFSTSTSFTLTVPAGAPTAPGDVLSTPVGSGFVVTWNPPSTGTPLGYAVSWGTANDGSNLPVQLVPFNRFEVTAAPPGTYYLRVHAVGQAQLSPASFQTQVIVTSSAAIPGPPLALEASADAQSLTGTWRAPQIGGAPSIYEVQVGTGIGLNNVASLTTATLSQRTPVPAGSYWIRSRAAAGGNAGPWTSSVQIPVAPGPCASAPGVPTMLPVTTTTGLVTFNWVAFGAAADRFEVEIATGLGLPAIATLPTTGPGSSLVWLHTGSGTGAARVVAINSCGRSTRSNEVGFTLP